MVGARVPADLGGGAGDVSHTHVLRRTWGAWKNTVLGATTEMLALLGFGNHGLVVYFCLLFILLLTTTN